MYSREIISLHISVLVFVVWTFLVVFGYLCKSLGESDEEGKNLRVEGHNELPPEFYDLITESFVITTDEWRQRNQLGRETRCGDKRQPDNDNNNKVQYTRRAQPVDIIDARFGPRVSLEFLIIRGFGQFVNCWIHVSENRRQFSRRGRAQSRAKWNLLFRQERVACRGRRKSIFDLKTWIYTIRIDLRQFVDSLTMRWWKFHEPGN